MTKPKPDCDERIEILRKTGVPVSPADEARVADSIMGSLRALADAAKGSLFDTEPQSFDRILRLLAKAPPHA